MTVVLQAPITVQLSISIVNDTTNQEGEATFSLPRGRFHSEDELRKALKDFEQNHMPEGFRLMTKREWFNTTVGQMPEVDDDGNTTMINISMPGGENWAE